MTKIRYKPRGTHLESVLRVQVTKAKDKAIREHARTLGMSVPEYMRLALDSFLVKGYTR